MIFLNRKNSAIIKDLEKKVKEIDKYLHEKIEIDLITIKTKICQEVTDYSSINDTLFYQNYPDNFPKKKIGLMVDIEQLQKENKKLKAIVSELCDYVYAERKQK